VTDHLSQPDAEFDLETPGEAAAPSTRQREIDPWAHRRAEPRLFAFLWTLYLFVTVLGSLLWLTRSGVLAASAYGPAARIMLIVIASGATILWPMVRLSQIAPREHPLGAAFGDLVVVVMPMQVVVWPLSFLANWPIHVVALLATMLLVWPALTGGLIAVSFAQCARRGAPTLLPIVRIGWMALCIATVCAGPLVVVLTAVGEHIDISSWAWKLSPFTFVFLLTGTGLRGPHAPIGLQDWYALLPVGLAAAFVWLLASAVASRRSGGDLSEEGSSAITGSIPVQPEGVEGGTGDAGGGGGRGAATRLDSPTNN
jgi:hypothetical protein